MPRAELYVGELLMKMVARQTGEISKVDFISIVTSCRVSTPRRISPRRRDR